MILIVKIDDVFLLRCKDKQVYNINQINQKKLSIIYKIFSAIVDDLQKVGRKTRRGREKTAPKVG